MSNQVPFAFEGMSPAVGHTVGGAVGVLVAFCDVVDEAGDSVEEAEEPPIDKAEVGDTDEGVAFSVESMAAVVRSEPTRMMFFAMRAPTTAPAIARAKTTPPIQYPMARQTFALARRTVINSQSGWRIPLFLPAPSPSSPEPTSVAVWSLSVLFSAPHIPPLTGGYLIVDRCQLHCT